MSARRVKGKSRMKVKSKDKPPKLIMIKPWSREHFEEIFKMHGMISLDIAKGVYFSKNKETKEKVKKLLDAQYRAYVLFMEHVTVEEARSFFDNGYIEIGKFRLWVDLEIMAKKKARTGFEIDIAREGRLSCTDGSGFDLPYFDRVLQKYLTITHHPEKIVEIGFRHQRMSRPERTAYATDHMNQTTVEYASWVKKKYPLPKKNQRIIIKNVPDQRTSILIKKIARYKQVDIKVSKKYTTVELFREGRRGPFGYRVDERGIIFNNNSNVSLPTYTLFLIEKEIKRRKMKFTKDHKFFMEFSLAQKYFEDNKSREDIKIMKSAIRTMMGGLNRTGRNKVLKKINSFKRLDMKKISFSWFINFMFIASDTDLIKNNFTLEKVMTFYDNHKDEYGELDPEKIKRLKKNRRRHRGLGLPFDW